MAEKDQYTIDDIHTYWQKHCTCNLADVATQPVPGVGAPASDIVFIGEAPGKNEDKEGVPFVGRAGKLLDEFLARIGRRREQIYITNVVKYRPPDNRDPLPQEIRDCLPWLIDELTIIAPKLIIPLGRHALQRFFSEARISDMHGTLLKRTLRYSNPSLVNTAGESVTLPTEYFFPLYHPAAALYNGSMKETLAADFDKIPTALAQI